MRGVKGDFQVQAPATDDPADVGPCDFVLYCVKTFDTDAAAAGLGPLVGDSTAVVSLQNGVENEEKLAWAVGEDHVMGGAAFIFAGIAEPGVIVHSSGPASITFGSWTAALAGGHNACWPSSYSWLVAAGGAAWQTKTRPDLAA